MQFADGDVAGAELSLETSVALDPSSAHAQYNLGKAYFASRKLTQCIAAHTAALSLPEGAGVPHAYVHNDLGNALSDASGRAAEVMHHYSRAAALMPSFAEALSNVGTSLKDQGRHEEAAQHFERAIGAKPTLCEAYKNLGSSYGEIHGRLNEAVGAFEGALAINPQVWNNNNRRPEQETASCVRRKEMFACMRAPAVLAGAVRTARLEAVPVRLARPGPPALAALCPPGRPARAAGVGVDIPW